MIKYISLIFIVIFLTEISLRFLGFGDPVLYEKKLENYYPKKNQQLRRFKGNIIKINDYGMRSNSEWKDDKNKKKILFFGDSVLFAGSYISNKDIFSEKICNFESVNFICGNYGVNGYKLVNVTDRIKSIDHKEYDYLIIVVSHSFTYGRGIFEQFPFYSNYDKKIFKATTEIINHILFKNKIIDKYHSTQFEVIISEDNKQENFSDQIKDFNSLVDKIKNEKNIFVFILPTLETLDGIENNEHFLEKLEKNKIVYNLYNNFKTKEYNELYFDNAHLNKKGHEYLSKIIYKLINENK